MKKLNFIFVGGKKLGYETLNFLIKKNFKINACSVNGKYMEIDTYNDFKLAKKMFKKK